MICIVSYIYIILISMAHMCYNDPPALKEANTAPSHMTASQQHAATLHNKARALTYTSNEHPGFFHVDGSNNNDCERMPASAFY